MSFQPLLELNYFQRISRSGENLREKRIRVERNRCDQRVQLSVWNFRRCFLSLYARRVRQILCRYRWCRLLRK